MRDFDYQYAAYALELETRRWLEELHQDPAYIAWSERLREEAEKEQCEE